MSADNDDAVQIGKSLVRFDPHFTQGTGAALTITFDDTDDALHYLLTGTPDEVRKFLTRAQIAVMQAEALERKHRR